MNNAQRVEEIKSPITWNREKGIYKAEFQKKDKKTGKETRTVELRQEVLKKSFYQTIKLHNEQNGSLFPDEAFGIDATPFEDTSHLVAWVPVPIDATPELVDAMVAAANERKGEIYRVLSFRPIIGEDQQYAIDNGLKTIDDFAKPQAARYSKNAKTIADGTAGTLILDKETGNVQYRKTFFWPVPRKDEDKRDPNDTYVSPELEKEVLGAVTFSGQTVV